MAWYILLHTVEKVGTLACKLDRVAIFRDNVVKHCAPMESREYPALPFRDLLKPKDIMLQRFPVFWNNPTDFEPVWKKCVEAIQQLLKD